MKIEIIIDETKEESVVITAHKQTELIDRIQALVMQYSDADRLLAYFDDDMVLLSFTDIECITILDGKTYAIDKSGKQFRLKLRLYEIETMMPPGFIRINKSTLANEKRIARFAASFSGAVDAVFKCGYREYVSRRCFAEIKRRYERS